MEYEEYMKLTHRAAQLVDSGKYLDALVVLNALVDSDISDRDKAMMCLNIAIVHDKLGEIAEALRWYERGIRYEQPTGQFFVAESKAEYLAARGRISESLAAYQALLHHPGLGESDLERVRHNIETLRDELVG